MGQRPLGRFISLFLLIAACAVVALIAGQLLFPGNLKPIILGWVILSLFVLLIPFLSWYLEAKRETTPRKDVISLFVSIASSLILIGSLGLAWLSLDNTQQQTKKNLELSLTTLENTRAEQRSGRFMEALEKLGGETPHKRLAGVYAFQKLDEDFKSDQEFSTWKESETSQTRPEMNKLEDKRQGELKEHWAIMEILTNFVRSQVSWPGAPTQATPQTTRDDVLQILRYLGQRKLTFGHGERKTLDLSKTDLRGYILNKTLSDDCDPADASKVDFEYVDFSEANLENIELRCAKLKGTIFWNANLRKAKLNFADLTGADFTGTNLEGADMDGATVTQERLDDAIIDGQTRCPAGFRPTPELQEPPDQPKYYKCVKA